MSQRDPTPTRLDAERTLEFYSRDASAGSRSICNLASAYLALLDRVARLEQENEKLKRFMGSGARRLQTSSTRPSRSSGASCRLNFYAMTADLTARIAQALSDDLLDELLDIAVETHDQAKMRPVIARLIAEETASLTKIEYCVPTDVQQAQIAEAEARGRAAILAEIRTLPSPVRLMMTISDTMTCSWCQARWAILLDHPANGCLWARAQESQ